MSARDFNRVRVALSRLGGPLRLPLTNLRDLGIFLDEELWVCFDGSLNDIPVVAWTDFDAAGRSGMHSEVPCTLRLYHSHAGVVIDKVLATVYDLLDKKFDETGLPRDGGVTHLTGRPKPANKK